MTTNILRILLLVKFDKYNEIEDIIWLRGDTNFIFEC